jgi:hypothetical protein
LSFEFHLLKRSVVQSFNCKGANRKKQKTSLGNCKKKNVRRKAKSQKENKKRNKEIN